MFKLYNIAFQGHTIAQLGFRTGGIAEKQLHLSGSTESAPSS